MYDMNKVILVGRLGQDPELQQCANGSARCRLRIATSRKFKQGEQWVERTDWHTVVCWNNQAEQVHRFLSKGSACLVEGRLAPRSYQDREGQNRYMVEVYGERVIFLPSGSSEGRVARASRKDDAPTDRSDPSPDPSPDRAAASVPESEPTEAPPF